MDINKEKDKKYIKEIFNEIGTWNAEDIIEKFYKNGEEIPESKFEEDNSSKKTVYLEDGEPKFEIISNGSETILVEYENGEEVEKFIISEEDLFELLNIDN